MALVDGPSSAATLVTYDESRRAMPRGSFVEAAQRALDDVCDMRMGSYDCEQQAACMRAAARHGANATGLDLSTAPALPPPGLLGAVLAAVAAAGAV